MYSILSVYWAAVVSYFLSAEFTTPGPITEYKLLKKILVMVKLFYSCDDNCCCLKMSQNAFK